MGDRDENIPNEGYSLEDIQPGADLQEADLSGADLNNADLQKANLSGANLSGTDLRDANLSGADLIEANLSRANLIQADLSDAMLARADLSEANFERAMLDNANLARANLLHASLTAASMVGANLFDADLVEADFYDADLSNANLTESNLSYSDLSRVNLADADVNYADLTGAIIVGTDLSNTDFEGSDLSQVDLSGVSLEGTKLDSCELKGANLRRVEFEDVSLDGFTSCEIQNEGYDVYRPVNVPVVGRVIKTRPRWLPGVWKSNLDSRQWDQTAQSYHKFKRILKSHGLVGKARRHHLRERGARRCEAWAAKDRLRWLKSALVWQLTGYGVSVRRIFRNMLLVFVASTYLYLRAESRSPGHPFSENFATVPEFLFYSTVTFTTTPPYMPSDNFLIGVVMVEAFVGTLLIVFLGYVLGTREQF